jgi:hypothetical protein
LGRKLAAGDAARDLQHERGPMTLLQFKFHDPEYLIYVRPFALRLPLRRSTLLFQLHLDRIENRRMGVS